MPDFAFLDFTLGQTEPVYVHLHGTRKLIGFVGPSGPAIRSHDGTPVQPFFADSQFASPEKPVPQFWCRASALHWLEARATVALSH